ncbi:5-(carboxyamino)imidazole ribonucleotide synthase [Kiloniella laminariae]|uniref:5-(carboxyamino)imidazole ribonucleotide synthase n=1 Tax=Kiloniella laminariae TaxID=454162 RepID=UPI0003625503|nr:5-(carboxyamino)imidazole ribonucleotide synthase [Kiloniella laminariae]
MSKTLTAPLAPGSVIGILGGGQLGRMAASAAAELGYHCHIFSPEENSPASEVSKYFTVANYDDEVALAKFAEQVDVVTYEFENVPASTAAFLIERIAVNPGPKVLHICQNRLREKDFCNSIKVPTTKYAEVTNRENLDRVVRDMGRPCILKTTEMGYDGKGQVFIGPDTDLKEAWKAVVGDRKKAETILEAVVDFRMEISVIVARSIQGACQTYVPVENRHKNHILDQTIVPARISQKISDRAEVIARHMAEEMQLVGMLAIEMFVTTEDEVLVNEMAPRPHNSGHWSMDACVTSQFEQFIRAVSGLSLGSVYRHSDAVMTNLLGDDVNGWEEILSDPSAKLHLYGKAEAKPGRKMGHVTRVIPRK